MRMLSFFPIAGVTAKLCLVVSAVSAQDLSGELIFFHTPTGNIHCMIDQGENPGVRCDLLQVEPSFTDRPSDCDLDWGDSFWIGPEEDSGSLVCHGDTVADPLGAVLDYGQVARGGGVVCVSAKTGLTCQTAEGHGFFLSRKEQKVF